MNIYPPDSDREFQRVLVEAVTVEGADRYSVLTNEGYSLLVGPSPLVPVVGDRLRLYGRGFGYEVRGVVIEGVGTVRYESEAELRDRYLRERAERDAVKQRALDEQRAERDLRVRELPPPLRARVERFQRARPTWRRDFEPYELFVCEEAAKLAEHFADVDVGDGGAVYRLNEWAQLGYAEQQQEVTLSDGHSGNTFDHTVVLARLLLLEDDELVIKMHGALCPLVGCEEYGCAAAASS